MIQLNCCNRCQLFNNCAVKWVRGQKAEADVCCSDCRHYYYCQYEVASISQDILIKKLAEKGIIDQNELEAEIKKFFYNR